MPQAESPAEGRGGGEQTLTPNPGERTSAKLVRFLAANPEEGEACLLRLLDMTSFPSAPGKLQALATELGRIEPNYRGPASLVIASLESPEMGDWGERR